MFIGIAAVVALAVLAAGLRVWTEFGQRTRKLHGEIDHNERLITDHAQKLEQARARAKEIKGETESLLRERGQVEARVLELRERVTELEERLERSRPKSHRVDKSSKDDFLG